MTKELGIEDLLQLGELAQRNPLLQAKLDRLRSQAPGNRAQQHSTPFGTLLGGIADMIEAHGTNTQRAGIEREMAANDQELRAARARALKSFLEQPAPSSSQQGPPEGNAFGTIYGGGNPGGNAPTSHGLTWAPDGESHEQAQRDAQASALSEQLRQNPGLLALTGDPALTQFGEVQAAMMGNGARNSEWDRRNAITSQQELERAHVLSGQRAQERAADRRDAAVVRQEQKEIEAARRAEEKAAADHLKRESQVREIDERAANADRALADLEAQVTASGTFALMGPAQGKMESAITDYAIDMAKLKDPTSVARETEVEMEKRALFKPGSLTTRNETALELIRNARQKISDRRREAYRVRGLKFDEPKAGGGQRRVRDPKTGRTGTWDGKSPLPPGVEVIDG